MRILNIHFKNINSLEGENWVDFEQAPFSDTGVFAVTGPNGSGKSSLLDAITLGLFGETFRFDRPASHVMTRHTAMCFAEIEFALDGERYQSSWHVERADASPDGDLMPPAMQLIRLHDGEVLANTPQQVCTQITAITGMNFRNFTRSILLAQGDFAAFLNALDSERMDILEKLISTDIYADYRQEIVGRTAHAEQELARLKQELAAIELVTPEAQEALEHDLIDFTEHLAELKDEQNSLKQQQVLLMNIAGLKKQIAEQEKSLELAQTQLQDTTQIMGQIAAAKDALSFKDDLEAQRLKNHQIHQGKSALDDFLQELEHIKSQLGNGQTVPDTVARLTIAEQQHTLLEIREQINQLNLNRQTETAHWLSLTEQSTQQQTTFLTLSSWLEEHAAKASLLTDFPDLGQLKKLRSELAELTGKQKTLTKHSQKTIASLNNNAAALAKERKNQAQLTQQLQAAQQAFATMAEGHTLADLDTLRLELQERVKDLQTLYKLAQKNQQLTGGTGFFSLFRRQGPADYDADALSIELEKLRLEIKREENIKRVLDESVIREGLLKKMAPDRVHLADGKPCPFCGALQHPYAKYPPVLTHSKQALIDQKAKLRLLLEKAANTARKITEAQQQSEKKQAKQLRLQQLRGQWLNLCNRLNVASDGMDITQLSLMKPLLKKATAELTELVNFATRFRGKQANIEKLTALIAKSEATIGQLQLNAGQLSTNTEGLSQEQLDINAALTQCQNQEQRLTLKVQGQLAMLGEKMPGKGKENLLIDRLNAHRQEYHGYAFRHQNLSVELATLAAKQAACQTEMARCNEQLELLAEQLQTQETISLHLALIEKQQLIADKEQLLAQQEQAALALHQGLLARMQGSQYTSLQQIGDSLQLIQRQPELLRQRAELEQAIDAITLALEADQTQLAGHSSGLASALNATEVAEQLRRVTRKMDIANMEAQQRERLLNEQQQLRQAHHDLSTQLQQQEMAFKPYFAEAALLTAENGMAFRRRVQERIADKLLSQTNALLEKISGRYYLRQAPSEQGLALEVEDTYQNNARRLPKTLSGGESFVVSLALALGLSELANNGRSVDSLFLDEGFGNLDAESLYTVISTLESLHTHGKTVGVISHVEAVQKRIKAQLQVVKKPNGMGELKKAF